MFCWMQLLAQQVVWVKLAATVVMRMASSKTKARALDILRWLLNGTTPELNGNYLEDK